LIRDLRWHLQVKTIYKLTIVIMNKFVKSKLKLILIDDTALTTESEREVIVK
jgi:hypothetical protein